MSDFKLLISHFKGYEVYYFGAVIFTALGIIFSRLVPLVTKFAIDNILGGKGPDSIFSSLFFELINNLTNSGGTGQKLAILGIAVVFFSLLNGIFSFLRESLSGYTAENISKKLRTDLYNVILRAESDFYSKFQSGDVIQRCTSDVDNIRKFLANDAISIWRIAFMIVFSLYIMFSLSVKLTLISLVTIPILVGTAFWFYLTVKKHFKTLDESEGKVTNVVQENITGVRVVKAFNREDYEIEKFLKSNTEYKELDLKLLKKFAIFWNLSDLLALLQFATVILLGSYFVVKDEISVGTLVAFTTYIGMLLWPARDLGILLSNFGKVKVSLKRISELLEQSIEETLEETLENKNIQENNESTLNIQGEIEFKDVWFSYIPEHDVLKGVSFKIEKGETVALFGGTGAGKSTIISLLMKLYEPSKGEIYVDGIEIRKIPKKVLRRQIGVVPQESFLFSRSVKSNIALTKIDSSDIEIIQAAKLASVHKDIIELEDSYDTVVGERGVTLSGGQRQRIAIARMLLKGFPIVIFDDSMSAIDTQTEKQIRSAIKQIAGSATTVIISHRISSIMDADKIIVLENGVVTHIGSHEELINTPGLYQKVWKIENVLKNAEIAEIAEKWQNN